MADLTKDLHRILKDSEQELAQLMFNYLSFQFGEQVSVSDDYRSGKTDNSVAKLTKNNTKHLRSNTGALLYSFFERDTFDIN